MYIFSWTTYLSETHVQWFIFYNIIKKYNRAKARLQSYANLLPVRISKLFKNSQYVWNMCTQDLGYTRLIKNDNISGFDADLIYYPQNCFLLELLWLRDLENS